MTLLRSFCLYFAFFVLFVTVHSRPQDPAGTALAHLPPPDAPEIQPPVQSNPTTPLPLIPPAAIPSEVQPQQDQYVEQSSYSYTDNNGKKEESVHSCIYEAPGFVIDNGERRPATAEEQAQMREYNAQMEAYSHNFVADMNREMENAFKDFGSQPGGGALGGAAKGGADSFTGGAKPFAQMPQMPCLCKGGC